MTIALRVRSIEWFERQVPFRIPFRFGAATVTGAPQLFLHAEIEADNGRCLGATAELMVPKWFNKDPALTPDETVAQLRRALTLARELYLRRATYDTAFGHHAAHHDAALAACAQEGIPALAAAFGPAQIDKAILDALLRTRRLDVFSRSVDSDECAALDFARNPGATAATERIKNASAFRGNDAHKPPHQIDRLLRLVLAL